MTYSIFTIIKDEHQYLDEWIKYHIDLGIDKIYVYDDVLSKSHKEICEKYYPIVEHTNIINLVPIKDKNRIIQDKQRIMKSSHQVYFMKLILNHLHQTTNYDWIFYIDIDEFLTFENSFHTFDNIFSQFTEYNMAILYSEYYNANGYIRKPEYISVIDTFTQTCGNLYKLCKHKTSKLVFNMNLFSSELDYTHHYPKSGKYCNTDFSTELEKNSLKKIYMRHYVTKSFEEYVSKIYIRGQFGKSKSINIFFLLNTDIDPNCKEVEEVKQKIQNQLIMLSK